MIFLDSTLLVRSKWSDGECQEAGASPEKSNDFEWLSCGERKRQQHLLRRLLGKHPRDDIWRVLVAHHPLDTVGSHGGARWAAHLGEVVGEKDEPCSLQQRPLRHLANGFDPEDLCTEGSRNYRALVFEAIKDANVPVHVVLSGHDHSLQFLSLDRVCEKQWPQPCPAVQIVSGAGAETTVVKNSDLLGGYLTAVRLDKTGHVDKKARGKSRAGWVKLRFSPESIEVTFYSGQDDITKEMTRKDLGGMSPIVLGPDGRPSFWPAPDGAR